MVTDYLYGYKKIKILVFKSLVKLENGRKFFFLLKQGIFSVFIVYCNNLNEIVFRNFLGIFKLILFFGLQKDLSDKLFKNESVWDKVKTVFLDRGSDRFLVKENIKFLEKISNDLINLKNKLDEDFKNFENKVIIILKDLEIQIKVIDFKIESEFLSKE